MTTEQMTLPELIQFIDLYSRCRDNTFRRDVLYNLRRSYPEHEITTAMFEFDKKYPRRDKEFRQAVRRLLKGYLNENEYKVAEN